MFLLGRRSMIVAWADLFKRLIGRGETKKKEFVSVDARHDMKSDTRSYEMLSRENSTVVTPASAVTYPPTSEYNERHSARYHAPTRSFSTPRSPVQRSWDPQQTSPNLRAPNSPPPPLHTPRSPRSPRSPQLGFQNTSQPDNYESMNPLGMNRI